MPRDITNFDPYNASQLPTCESGYFEKLLADNWTIDPAVYDYRARPATINNMAGQLAQSWEFTDSTTLVFHLRQGVHWQDIPPVNGREFTADDVAYHFSRQNGWAPGTTPSPFQSTGTPFGASLISVTASDKYTVVFKWKTPNPEYIIEAMQSFATGLDMEAREAVQLWGNVNDWHHAIGTGPFILTDFVSGSSATLTKNNNYWGYDERYPQNKLPYVDTLKVLIIPDNSTALAAVRSGKIEAIDQVSIQDALSMQKTNSKIVQTQIPPTANNVLSPRNDVKPFTDIRVRIAMQKAIDLPTIVSSYFLGYADATPASLASNHMIGWGYPYNMWTQTIKDQYTYDPVAAKKLLADAGYPSGFNTNIVAAQSSDMDLLQIVKSYLAAVGINMEIRPMDQTSWTNFVFANHKQDQMSTRGGGELGQVSEPLRQIGSFLSTQVAGNYPMVSDPVYDGFYNKGISANSVEQAQQAFKDACEYTAGQHYEICLPAANTFGLYQPWLKGYYGQFDSVSGGTVGAHLLGFYCARFWIDQNLKKSLGN
jgi:peptide/nickel transport system substrate-binding protein